MGGVFDAEILTKMGKWNDKPVVFPLSNPSSKSECTFEEAMKYTDGRVLFASGSPFPEMHYKGRTYHPGQGM
jgi:malate dehydrogenase (oxaloacetate-decarboxylating)(NADP+)